MHLGWLVLFTQQLFAPLAQRLKGNIHPAAGSGPRGLAKNKEWHCMDTGTTGG